MPGIIQKVKSFNPTGSLAIILYFSILRLLIHFVFGSGYGYFRDEFYYIACSDHLDFGYVDHPPLIALITKISKMIFGDSIFAIRILPAVAGSTTIFIIGLITKELGGGKFALVIAGIASLFSPVLLAGTGYLSMNAFDIMFWTAAFYVLVLIIKNNDEKLWIHFGVIAGIGLLNKISILFLGFGLAIGLILTANRKYFFSKYFWIGAAIALMLFLPHILWQIVNGWPTLEFISNASAHKIAEKSAIEFIIAHFLELHPTSVILLIAGLLFFFFKSNGREFRILVIIYFSVLLLLISRNSKPYYMAVLNPIVIAMGAAAVDKLIKEKLTTLKKYALIIFLLPGYLWSVPFVVPVLPVDNYISYADFFGMKPSSDEKKEIGLLPQQYADRFGWYEIVDAVKMAYDQLSGEEKSKALVFAQNYGEAGAVDLLGKKYGLPEAISGHNSYWLWGYPENYTGEVLIIIGGSRERYSGLFESMEHVSTAINKYAMPYENNLPVFICRNLKGNPKDLWQRVKNFN